MRTTRIVGAVLALVLPMATLVPAGAARGPGAVETTLSPTDDLFVHSATGQTGTTFVTNRLLVGGGREALLRFDVPGLPAGTTVIQAKLRMYKAWGPGTELVFSEAADTWDRSVTYTTRPAVGKELLRQGVGAAGAFYDFDLTSGVRAAADEGRRFSLHVNRSAAQNASEFASSREPNAEWRPRLVVTTMTHREVVDADAADLGELDGRLLYQDIALPTQGKRGSRISWESDNPAAVTEDGKTTRPTGESDARAVLTATVTHHDAAAEKKITLVVRRIVAVTPKHPQIHTDAAEKDALVAKVRNVDWAKNSFEELKKSIDPLADRHVGDPEWILSRMAMFWTDGARCTQVYITAQRFDRCEGNAPVPTVRYPAMRIWNANRNAPLEQRIPYSRDGSMRNEAGQVVPYAETGHMVRLNNEELLKIAQKAAFLYQVTDEEKYAKFGADIYWQWLLGVYYMNPALDPTKSLGGPGGYLPGGIGGYYDYEVIHDPMGGLAAVVYDFLYDYLNRHPDPHAARTGKNVTELSNEVFKRFIDIGMVRGGFSGNWNVNGWDCILPAILALETNDYYPDGKGKEHYLRFYTTQTTQYHQALPEILKEYDKVTGLWHESPGYAFGTIGTLLNVALPVRRAGTDTIAGNTVMDKAAAATTPWLDARGNLVVFGDMRGGPPNFQMFERLLTYYTETGDSVGAARVSSVLKGAMAAGQYQRNAASWIDIIENVELVDQSVVASDVRTAYSAHHRHMTLKNKNDIGSGLMATLYGGYPSTDHLSPNGLALQLYGRGWALAPNAKAYESYWSDDYAYHRGPAGANTIVPGYTSGPVTVNAVEPAVAPDSFTNSTAISPDVQFADMSAAEKRRQVAIIRTSDTTGYYVDVFRSDQADNDYLQHNLGNRLVLEDSAGQPLPLNPATDLGAPDPNYRFFQNARSAGYSGDLNASWTIDASPGNPEITMDMWMRGQQGRTVYQVDAPPTTIIDPVTPNKVNKAPQTTPTAIIRQQGNNAATAPFVAVFEPHTADNKSVRSIADLGSSGSFVGLKVTSTGEGTAPDGRVDHVLSSSDGDAHTPAAGIGFTGVFGVASEDRNGFHSLYLGRGHQLRHGDHGIRAVGTAPVAAGLTRVDGGLQYSAGDWVEITLPFKGPAKKVKIAYQTKDGWVTAESSANAKDKTVTARVPAGHDVAIKVIKS